MRDGMRKELVNEEEVMASLRLQGISDMREVKRAVMESTASKNLGLVFDQHWLVVSD